MNVEPVDLGEEIVVGVDLRLAAPPIVCVAPMRDDPLRLGKRNALAPIVDGFFLRPAHQIEPLGQIVERRLRNVDSEGAQVEGQL